MTELQAFRLAMLKARREGNTILWRSIWSVITGLNEEEYSAAVSEPLHRFITAILPASRAPHNTNTKFIAAVLEHGLPQELVEYARNCRAKETRARDVRPPA